VGRTHPRTLEKEKTCTLMTYSFMKEFGRTYELRTKWSVFNSIHPNVKIILVARVAVFSPSRRVKRSKGSAPLLVHPFLIIHRCRSSIVSGEHVQWGMGAALDQEPLQL